MKTIKIKFVGFYEGFNPDKFLMIQLLKKHYKIEITDQPDYIICSESGKFYEYCNYPQVRIMYSGENYIPDLNLVDYAICDYPISFFDRCFFMPLCIGSNSGHGKFLDEKSRNYTDSILKDKKYFANIIASHDSECGYRSLMFKKLSAYKRVESPGTFMNNMPNGEVVQFKNDSKVEFQRKCKFSLCLESTKHEGFVTEKIADAFYADTIPIYYGSDTVSDIFNPDAFINLSAFKTFDEAIERIIELDQDDDEYMRMLRQPIFNEEGFAKKTLDAYENYLLSIFEQPLEKAYRRSRVYSPKRYNDFFVNMYSPQRKTSKTNIYLRKFIRKLLRR